MASEPLPDHYKALGVDRSADPATIKTVYRKLVLKCHPDKVTDLELKQQKQEEFHKIQEAYEVLVDDEKRSDYEARLHLEQLRKERAARASTHDKTARFDVRTNGASFATNAPSRYSTEERKPSRAYDEDDCYYQERSRNKYDIYTTYSKPSPPRSGRTEKESSSKHRPSNDRTRSERVKTRDREIRNERKVRGNDSDSSSDEMRNSTEYKRRSVDDEIRKARKQEDRRSYEEPRYNSQRKMSAQEEEAKRYQQRSGTLECEPRSSPPRQPRDYFSPPRKESRPEPVRRSSARPKERERTNRLVPEIVEWKERRPPAFTHSSSSPANIQIPRAMRSQTDNSREYRERDRSPPAAPSFQRSATMNSVPNTSSRRKESVQRSSGLRGSATPGSTKVEQEEFASIPQPQTSTRFYHYPTPGGGVPLRQEDVIGAGNHRTILREPDRRHRSPSPLTRPPMGANRPSEPVVAQFKSVAPPSLTRSSTARHISPMRTEDRGRTSRPSLFRELASDSRGRQASYGPSNIQYGRRYGPDDVHWAPRAREDERDYAKPSLGRSATTMAY